MKVPQRTAHEKTRFGHKIRISKRLQTEWNGTEWTDNCFLSLKLIVCIKLFGPNILKKYLNIQIYLALAKSPNTNLNIFSPHKLSNIFRNEYIRTKLLEHIQIPNYSLYTGAAVVIHLPINCTYMFILMHNGIEDLFVLL